MIRILPISLLKEDLSQKPFTLNTRYSFVGCGYTASTNRHPIRIDPINVNIVVSDPVLMISTNKRPSNIVKENKMSDAVK